MLNPALHYPADRVSLRTQIVEVGRAAPRGQCACCFRVLPLLRGGEAVAELPQASQSLRPRESLQLACSWLEAISYVHLRIRVPRRGDPRIVRRAARARLNARAAGLPDLPHGRGQGLAAPVTKRERFPVSRSVIGGRLIYHDISIIIADLVCFSAF